MIHYNRHSYNCAHHAINVINSRHGLDIKFSHGDEWQPQFLRTLRERFKPIPRPIDDCLVVMTQKLGGLHLGVYSGFHVEHNYQPIGGAGSVIKSDMGTIRSEYSKVRFYAPVKAI